MDASISYPHFYVINTISPLSRRIIKILRYLNIYLQLKSYILQRLFTQNKQDVVCQYSKNLNRILLKL